MLPSSKKRYPVVAPDMLKPEGVPIPTVIAKGLYKEFMVEIGYLDKREAAGHVRYFAEEMREHEEYLREELARVRDEDALHRPELKQGLPGLRRDLADAIDPELRAFIEEEIASYLEELAELDAELSEAKEALQSFRRDKRHFFVEYVNRELHGRSSSA